MGLCVGGVLSVGVETAPERVRSVPGWAMIPCILTSNGFETFKISRVIIS